MTEEEIAELEEAYKKAILEGTANTKAWADRMADAKVGIDGYTAALRASKAALKESMIGLGKSIADGETGASVFTGGIKAGADRMDMFFIKKLGPAGAVLGGITKAAAAYVGAVSKQADALYKSYQDISRTGTIGFTAMTGVYDNMKKFGYGIKELDKFGSLMAENSKDLSNFGGTAVNGAKVFANLADELQHSPITLELLDMGVSVDEINKSAAGFIKQQTMIGRGQKDIGEKLTQSTLKYINELETMSRLTGQTRAEQEEKLKDARSEQAFNAKMRELERKKAAGDMDAANELVKMDQINLLAEGDMRKQLIRAMGGDIASLGPLLNIGGADLIDALYNPTKTAGDVLGTINEGYKRFDEAGGSTLQMLNAFDGDLGKTAEYERLRSKLSEKSIDQAYEEARINKKAGDGTTQTMNKTEIAQRKARDNIQDFINFGIDPVTKVMEILAKALEWLTDLLPGAGAAREQYEAEKRAAMPSKAVGVWNKDNKIVYVSAEEAAKIKAGEAEAPAESTVAGPGAGASGGTASPKAALADKIMMAESGGRNVANQSGEGGKATSTATGLFQFTKGTFEDLAKNAKQGSALYGKTFEDYKKDTNLQREAMNVLMDKNAASLSSKGLGTSDANMYLAHFLGAGGAAKALSAGPNALLTDVMTQEQLAANPSLKSMRTVADLQAWAEKKMGGATAVPTGPNNGYQAAVTPAAEGQPRQALAAPKTAEVKKEEAEDESKAIMAAQVDKMNDIVRVMEKQTAITGKILQRSSG